MTTMNPWAKDYARQAAADLDTWKLLFHHNVPMCHRLQFLQMTCEKLCKAHLIAAGQDPKQLQSSHAFIAGPLPTICKRHYWDIADVRNRRVPPAILRAVEKLSREIELLAPAPKAGGRREDNCEYPWEGASGALIAPVDHRFEAIVQLLDDVGPKFFKILQRALAEFNR